MNYSRFGEISELELVQVVASETVVWWHGLRPKKVNLHQKKVNLRTFRRQQKCFECVIIHERATHFLRTVVLIIYLNNVLSCTHYNM